jgi:hypothetical protein
VRICSAADEQRGRRTNLHLTLRLLGDAVDPMRLAALGKNLSEMPPRRPLSSAILHFLWQDCAGTPKPATRGVNSMLRIIKSKALEMAVRGLEVTKRPNRQGSAGPATALIAACNR